MTAKKGRNILLLINGLIIFFILIFHSTDIINLKIFYATPMIPLAFLVAVSMFTSELTASITGLLIGAVTDSVSGGGSLYHTIFFFIIAAAVSFIAKYLFNNNVRSAVVLCVLSGGIYYFLRWLLLYAFNNAIGDRLPYILSVALPSCIYTAIFVIPFYFLEKYLFNKFYK